MGIQNRDRVKAQKQTARLRPVELKVLLAIVAVAFGIGATGAWMSPKAGAVVVPTGVQEHAVHAVSAATEGQESGNPVLIGTVTQVLDGDTIKVALDPGPITVRFGSIDAPEKSQPAGPAAREVLTRRLGHVKAARYCTAEESTAGGCRIKGNVGSSGKVYHVPGSGAYDKTVITESKGERWFCTKEEARAAGWRAPRG